MVLGMLQWAVLSIGDSEKVDVARSMPFISFTVSSKLASVIDLVFVASKNSPRVGLISIGVVPRSDLTSNFATETPSLSVADANTIPSETVVTLSFFSARISGGATTCEGAITPLDEPCLWTILTCLSVPSSALLYNKTKCKRNVSSMCS